MKTFNMLRAYESNMKDSEYQELLSWIQNNRGGIGDKRIQYIKKEFPDGDDFVDACRDAYQNRNFDRLMKIKGIGRGYAQGKLALAVAEYYDWSGGDSEPKSISVNKFSDIFN